MHAIGIDMSKASFHAALDDALVKRFANTGGGIGSFMEEVAALGCVPADTLVGVEATGVYHLLLSRRAADAGFTVLLINPLLSHRFNALTTLRRRKTDAIDAANIRDMLRLGMGRPFVETDDVLALKALVAERDGLVQLRSVIKNRQEARTVRLQSIVQRVYDPSPKVLRVIDGEIRVLNRRLLGFVPDIQALLRSIPGVGPATAATLIAHIGDIRRFPSPEKLVAYVGLDCRVHESGTSVKGASFISKRGSRQLRTMLYNAAFIARRRNPALTAYFEKKRSEGKHYLSAMNAVERKLVHIVWAVWTRGTPFVARG